MLGRLLSGGWAATFVAVLLVGVGVWFARGPVAGAASLRSSLPLAQAGNSGGGRWGSAEEVPGTAKLNAGGGAQVLSLSCASAGNCAAGGFYADGSGKPQAFVVDEAGGTWGGAREVPGTAKLNAGGRAEVLWLSCASAGNCAAGGFYADGSGNPQAFVVDEVGGRWGRAREVPGTAKLNTGGGAEILSLSCASPGNCAAGGAYQSSSNEQQAFVVDEVGGRWRRAREVPGTAKLNTGGGAEVLSLSCASPGNCAAGGLYRAGPGFPGHPQAFVVDEVGGRWRRAQEVPGTAKLNTFGDAEVNSLSCASVGGCAAGGFYTDGSGSHAFVVDEVGGRWRRARKVPGAAKLNARRIASVYALSCASAGNCAAGGVYFDGSRHFQAFVVDEVGGRWGTAAEIPGTATLNRGTADVNSLSCASAGNCAAGGVYFDGSRHFQAFVVNEVGGRWGTAQEVPGTATLNAGGRAWVASLSCASAGGCAAGGFYTDGSGNLGHQQAFVVDYRPAPTATRAQRRRDGAW